MQLIRCFILEETVMRNKRSFCAMLTCLLITVATSAHAQKILMTKHRAGTCPTVEPYKRGADNNAAGDFSGQALAVYDSCKVWVPKGTAVHLLKTVRYRDSKFLLVRLPNRQEVWMESVDFEK